MIHDLPRWAGLYLPLCACLTLPAQPAGSFSIAGRVVNSVTGEPVKRALVMLYLNRASPRNVLADDAGTFRFTNLNAGSYRISAEKPQFANDASTIVIGPSRDNVDVKLKPLATIEGTVLDTAGLPIPGVNIKASTSSIVRGRRTFRESRNVTTNDQGRYRLWNLRPGAYYLRIAGRTGGTRQFVGETAPRMDWPETVASVYYGNAESRSMASPITVREGEHIRADFAVPLQAAFKIRGTIANYASSQKIIVELLNRDGETVGSRVAVITATGRFEANDVIPGDFVLRATQGEGDQQTRGEIEVHVGAANVDGVELQLSRGVTLPVKFHCEREDEIEDGNPCFVIFRLASRDGAYVLTMADAAGSMSLKNVLPGEYRPVAEPFGRYVASATMGAVDILSTGKLTIQPGAAIEPIEVWLRSDGGVVEGTIEVDKPPPEMAVLLIPEFSTIVEPVTVPVGGDGKFASPPMAPGEYTAYAVHHWNEVEYANPEVRRAFSNGVRVRITPKSREQMKIRGLAQ